MFVDETKVTAVGGKGGDGCSSFRREKFEPKGGPDGGDGGNGGEVIFRVDHDEQHLIHLHYQPIQRGMNGGNGRGKSQHGADGKHTIVPVPPGTVVRSADTYAILADLVNDGDEFVAVHGGKGGYGNRHFVTSTNQAPRFCEAGGQGEKREYVVELKAIADAGLVGYPNAGKSSLLNAVSKAHPKTAPYPFTSLRPTVGIVEFDDFYRLKIADVPGLIEGAHKNVGLGDSFLRHVERAPVIVYVLDIAGTDNRYPWDDFSSLQKELDAYSPGMSRRPSLIVANKMDMPNSEDNLRKLRDQAGGAPIIPMSVLKTSNIEKFVNELRKVVESATSVESVV